MLMAAPQVAEFSSLITATNVVVAGLGLKSVLTTFLTIRCRIVNGDFRPVPEDANSVVLNFLIDWVFKLVLFICPPGKSETAPSPTDGMKELLKSTLETHRNSTEQEPWFMAMAITLLVYATTTGSMDTMKYTIPVYIIYAFFGGRVMHMLTFLLGLQPWRTIFFSVALFASLGFSVILLMNLQMPTSDAPSSDLLFGALFVLSGVLAAKTVVVTLMTVRNRIMTGEMRPVAADKENKALAFIINYGFKPVLLVGFGPAAPKPETNGQAVEEAVELGIWLGVHRNATEQEAWFLSLAIAYCILAGALDAFSMAPAVIILSYVALRVLHMLFYRCQAQPFRSICFALGMFAGTVPMSVFCIQLGYKMMSA
jgi:uncharacterized MAPEG superfamily protein